MSRPIENAYNPDPRNFAAVNWQLRKTPPSPTADSREWLFSLRRMLGRKKKGREEKGMEEWGAQLANYSKRVDPIPFRAYRYRSSVIRGGALYRPLSVSQPRCTVGWCDDAIFVQMNNTPLGWFIVSRLKDTLSWPITPVDNRWRTRRSKEVPFRRIRASSPRSTPNHPDELCDFSSIPGVSRLPCDINCAGTNAFSLRRGGGKKLTITGFPLSLLVAKNKRVRLSSGLDSFSFSSLFISRYFSSILRVVDNKFPLSRDNTLSPRLDFDEEKSSLTPLLPSTVPLLKKGFVSGKSLHSTSFAGRCPAKLLVNNKATIKDRGEWHPLPLVFEINRLRSIDGMRAPLAPFRILLPGERKER